MRTKLIERPPNYESLTLTNSSAEFGQHSLTSSTDNMPAFTKHSGVLASNILRPRQDSKLTRPVKNSTIIEDLKEEDNSFVQSSKRKHGVMGPHWKGSGEMNEPNPMDEELPELTISNNNTKDSGNTAARNH